jgi:sodium-dependent phosphate cotransporter
VGMVAGGVVGLSEAIPIVMGANIGTTVTNTLVSMGHVTNRIEFRRAFSAGIVHDFFNISAVLLLFPLEMKFQMIEKTAKWLENGFSGAGGLTMFNPLKLILDPAIESVDYLFSFLPYSGIMLLLASVIVLFGALTLLIKTIRSLVLDKLELIINRYLFRNDVFGFIFGILMTLVVQSSSVTTSIIIPIAGAGIITLRQIFPYTLGANIGTTGTAILAALATQNHIAVTVAFAHLCFNIFGIALFYPIRFIPIGMAEFVGRKSSQSKRNLILFISAYFCIYLIPLIFIFLL